MEIIPQGSAIGAEVRGLDLSRPLGDEALGQLNRVFLDYRVVFFPGQDLTPRQYTDFAAAFGKPGEYLFAAGVDGFPHITELVKTETETTGFGDFWHSDSAYLERPPKITMLYARQIPPRGGDTLFADMYALHDDLSPGLRAALAPLRALNSASGIPREEDIYREVRSRNSGQRDRSAIHPVVRAHDETGRRAIYVNAAHTLRFDGMTREESLPLLSQLFARVGRPEYAFRLRWEKNTLAMWDNRCVQHCALNDYHGFRRVMQRIIIEGPRPRGPGG